MNRSRRERLDRTRVLNNKDCNSQRDSSSSDDDVRILGEVSSKREESMQSSSSERSYHVMGCSYRHTNTCLCKDIINLENRRARISSKSFRDNSHSSILAGRFVDAQSTSSSETSFYSSQTNQANGKDSQSGKSSISSNYSTDKWNKNIETSASLTKDSLQTSLENISQDKNTSTETRDTNENNEEHQSDTQPSNTSTNTELDESNNNKSSSTTENIQYEPKGPINSSFLQKLKKVIDAPAQDDSSGGSSDSFFTRLSRSYMGNTDNFRKQLLTIMEENSMSQDIPNGELENLATKFIGICQYIQDESMPSMMLRSSLTSSLSTSQRPRTSESPGKIINNNGRKSDTFSGDLDTLSPLCSPVKKIKSHQSAVMNSSPLYRAALGKVTTPRRQPESPKLPSTPGTPGGDSFIRWEKYCEQLTTPGSNCKKKSNLRKSLSVPDFVVWSAKEEFLKKCQDQERSLDDSVFEDAPNMSYETYESHDRMQSSSGMEYHSLSSSILDDEDDFTRTIMLEVAKKRQRCYETEKTIREIDAASNTSRETSTNSESNKILEMFEFIKRSEDYDDYLTAHGDTIREATKRLSNKKFAVPTGGKCPRKQQVVEGKKAELKPIKAITPRPRSPGYKLNTPARRQNKSPSRVITASTPQSTIRQLQPGNLSSNSARKVPTGGTLQTSGKKATVSSSPCLSARIPIVKIVPNTPVGKTSTNVTPSPRSPRPPSSLSTPPLCNNQQQTPVTKRRFFVTPNKATGPSPITSRPRQKPKTYFSGLDDAYGYKNVKSPVGEYIRGTDTQLVQNVRAKRNSFLLTPKSNAADEDLKFKLTKSDYTPVNLSSISSPVLQHQAKMMMAENEENIPSESDFHLPQTNYEMPTEVHEIIGSPSKIRGARSRLLQEANERKVVTRHEGRVIPSLVDSLDSNLAEMSIHITNLASKTNYVGYLRREKD